MFLSYEILHLFTAPQGYLVEIKRLDQPSGTAQYRVFQWLWITERAVTTLRLVGMESSPRQTRIFREAQLSLDQNGAELRWCNGKWVTLETAAERTLDATRQRLVRDHLS